MESYFETPENEFNNLVNKAISVINNIVCGIEGNRSMTIMNCCLYVCEDVEMADQIYETIMNINFFEK